MPVKYVIKKYIANISVYSKLLFCLDVLWPSKAPTIKPKSTK